MALLCGSQIGELVGLLERRRAYLYHACQLRDFESYVRLGGIPSRQLLESSGLPYTRFDTDAVDRRNGVWGMVFGNLEDFGNVFARGKWGKSDNGRAFVPNPYGPITLVVRPQALLGATNVAVSLTSAGVPGFDREHQSLPDPAAVDRCYARGPSLESTRKLAGDYGLTYASNPEWSVEVCEARLPLKYVYLVRVEPIRIRGTALIELVRKAATGRGLQVYERNYFADGRRDLLLELCDLVSRAPGRSTESLLAVGASPALLQYIIRVSRSGMDIRRQFERFVEYLRSGTLATAESVESKGTAGLLGEQVPF